MLKQEKSTVDTPGIDTLLARDRKAIELASEAAFLPVTEPAAAAPDPARTMEPPPAGGRAPPAAAEVPPPAARAPGKQRRAELQAGPAAPRLSREAIDAGLQRFQQGEYQQAADLFQLALELPGSGTFRMSGSPIEYACPSEGEESSALYNLACTWCQLGKPAAALTCLEALFDNGFDDFDTVRNDPDLTMARGPELDKLLAKYDSLLGKLMGGKTKKQSCNDKPWFQW